MIELSYVNKIKVVEKLISFPTAYNVSYLRFLAQVMSVLLEGMQAVKLNESIGLIINLCNVFGPLVSKISKLSSLYTH